MTTTVNPGLDLKGVNLDASVVLDATWQVANRFSEHIQDLFDLPRAQGTVSAIDVENIRSRLVEANMRLRGMTDQLVIEELKK